MALLESVRSLDRERIESALSLLVFFLVAFWAIGAQIPLDTGWAPLTADLFLLPVLLVPGFLALFVLLGVLASTAGLASTLATTGALPRPGSRVALGIAGSILYGAVAAYTLWWASASFYLIYFGDPGGVLLQPFVVMAFGTVLSILVLLRAAFRRLFGGKIDSAVANAPP